MVVVGVVVTNALLVDTCCKRVSRQRSTRPTFHRQQTLSDGSASPPAQPISDDARRHVTSSFPATDVRVSFDSDRICLRLRRREFAAECFMV